MESDEIRGDSSLGAPYIFAMGRKSRRPTEGDAAPESASAGSASPVCYYCDRVFQSDADLIVHQKQQHFKCPHCARRFLNAPGLVTHVRTVHEQVLSGVPKALPGREDPSISIVGMLGVPAEYFSRGLAGSHQESHAPPPKRARLETYAVAERLLADLTPPPSSGTVAADGVQGEEPRPVVVSTVELACAQTPSGMVWRDGTVSPEERRAALWFQQQELQKQQRSAVASEEEKPAPVAAPVAQPESAVGAVLSIEERLKRAREAVQAKKAAAAGSLT